MESESSGHRIPQHAVLTATPGGLPEPVAAPLAFDEVYARYAPFVWRLLRGLGAPSVEDAAQDVFVVVHRRLAELEKEHAVKAWLAQIARRVAHDHRRTRTRKGGLEPLPEAVRDGRASPAERAEHREALWIVQGILDGLSDEHRAVIVMSDIAEMTAPEIAQALGLNLSTVYTRLRRGREAFNAAVASSERGGHD